MGDFRYHGVSFWNFLLLYHSAAEGLLPIMEPEQAPSLDQRSDQTKLWVFVPRTSGVGGSRCQDVFG